MKTYTIKEVTELFDLPASTLRYYEEAGLLTNIKRSGQRRIYEECHLNRLKTICCFKNTGMTIAQLQALIQMEDDPTKETEMLALLEQHATQLDAQLTEMLAHRQHIKRKQQFYQAKHQAHLTQQPEPDWQNYRQLAIKQDLADFS